MTEGFRMKKRHSPKERIYRGVAFALTLVCLALFVHEIWGNHGYLALRRQQKEYRLLQERINKLQQENQQLQTQIDALRSDPKAIERQAREQMHMARPGEIIFTLPEKDPKQAPPAAAQNAENNKGQP